METQWKNECGNLVSILIQQEQMAKEDPFVGYTDGINEVLQKKSYVYNNAVEYEKSRRQGISNSGHLKCSLILHYLKQEPDFSDWYVDRGITWSYFHTGY